MRAPGTASCGIAGAWRMWYSYPYWTKVKTKCGFGHRPRAGRRPSRTAKAVCECGGGARDIYPRGGIARAAAQPARRYCTTPVTEHNVFQIFFIIKEEVMCALRWMNVLSSGEKYSFKNVFLKTLRGVEYVHLQFLFHNYFNIIRNSSSKYFWRSIIVFGIWIVEHVTESNDCAFTLHNS